jgi:hypothetical protein
MFGPLAALFGAIQPGAVGVMLRDGCTAATLEGSEVESRASSR